MRPPSLPRRPFLQRPLVRLNALLLLGLAIFWAFFRPLPTVGGGQPDGWEARRLKARVYASIAPEDEAGFARIDPADPGGWLSAFRETPQPLETFQSQSPLRPTSARRTIVLQPIGALDARLLEDLRLYTEACIQLPARTAPPLPLPSSGTRAAGLSGRQFEAGGLLSGVLQPRIPDDALMSFGVTEADLWSADLHFVFGVGDSGSRTGIFSVARLRPSFWNNRLQPRGVDDKTLVLKRACRILSHEVGHVLGLWHCVFYRCAMNGSNSLLEADAAPLELCPVCHRKLLWSIGFDGAKRYEELLAFNRKHGFEAEAKWQQGRLERWKRIAVRAAALK